MILLQLPFERYVRVQNLTSNKSEWCYRGRKLVSFAVRVTIPAATQAPVVLLFGLATQRDSSSVTSPKQNWKLTKIPSWHLTRPRKCHAENVARSTLEKFCACAIVLAQEQETDVIWWNRKSLTMSFRVINEINLHFDTSTTRWSVINFEVNIAQNCLYRKINWNSRASINYTQIWNLEKYMYELQA